MTDSEPLPPCEHCRQAIPPSDLVQDPGSGKSFCCRGCLGAWRIITGAGLDDFYQKRDWRQSGPVAGAPAGLIDASQLAQRVLHHADYDELLLQVEGIHCAACVWLIERVLNRQAGMIEARLSHATHQLRVRYEPNSLQPTAIVILLDRLGYRPAFPSRNRQLAAMATERHSLLIRLGTALFFTLQVKGYSLALYAGYFQGMEAEYRLLIQAFAAMLAGPVVFYSGWPFLAGGFRSLRNRAPDMDLLVALGVLAAYGYSLYAMWIGGEVYFDSAAMIVSLILLGRLFEHGARRRASAGVERLLSLTPEQASRVDAAGVLLVEAASLVPGDLILVRPGERFPVDCRLSLGQTEVDEAIVSGEAMPVSRKAGEELRAGAINLGSAVQAEVLRPAADSFVARVAALVAEAQLRKAPVQRMADRVVAVFVPLVLLLALLTCLFWLGQGADLEAALLPAVAVLVVACPCALGLATPTAILVASGAAAGQGILFKGGDILERLAKVSLLAFDKTGTLSTGQARLAGIRTADGDDRHHPDAQVLLRLAGRLAQGSNHPLARAIVAEAAQQGVSLQTGSAEAVPGRGIVEKSAAGEIRLGKLAFLQEAGIAVPEAAHHQQTESHLAQAERYLGSFYFEDPPRPEAAACITGVKEMGIQTALLSGDHPESVGVFAARLGLDSALGGMEPAAKKDWIDRRNAEGELVLMVGDGINDAPALAAASVGCAMGGSTDIALESADLVLVKPDLGRLVEAIDLARRTLAVIRQNLFWAFLYNILALPLAAAGKLAPIHAAAAMAASSVCVLVNSLRLATRKKRC